MKKDYTEKELTEIVSLLHKLDKIDGEIKSTRVYFEEELCKLGGIPDKGRTVEDSYLVFLKEAEKFYKRSKSIPQQYKDAEVIKDKQRIINKEYKKVQTLLEKILEINKN